MAAYCGCCGAELSGQAEVCAACGTPRHGMMPSGFPLSLADPIGSVCCQETSRSEPNELTSANDPAK